MTNRITSVSADEQVDARISVTVHASGMIMVRHVREDGSVHRTSYEAGDDISEAGPEVRAAAAAAWTPEVLATRARAVLSPEDLVAGLRRRVQAHLDDSARAAGYDSIFTACTYADEPAVARFQADGRAFRQWRSLVWASCTDVLDDVKAERRDVPSAEELLALLPKLD